MVVYLREGDNYCRTFDIFQKRKWWLFGEWLESGAKKVGKSLKTTI